MAELKLTEEQKEFLATCEEEFKDRYTDKDEAFMKIHGVESKKPPIIDPWYNRPRRNYDWTRQNHGQSQSKRNHAWDRHNKEKNDKLERHGDKHNTYHRNVNRPY